MMFNRYFKYLFLMISICFTLCLNVQASQEETTVSGEIVDLNKLSADTENQVSLMSMDDGIVELKIGNYERWIDRVDFSKQALKLYETLEEYCDYDGTKDFLISNEFSNKDNATIINFPQYNQSDTFYAYKFIELKNPTDEQADYIWNTMRSIYRAFEQDHPEVFWLQSNPKGYGIRIGTTENSTVTFYFLFKMHEGSYSEAYDLRQEQYQISGTVEKDISKREEAISAILNTDSVRSAENDCETVKALNNWLTKNNEYNTAYVNNANYHSQPAHECLSALTGNSGTEGPVCEGYAKAFKVLCDRLNIACVMVTGSTYNGPENDLGYHAWNSFRIDGVWYGADITWNDPTIKGVYGAVSGYENEKYLFVGTQTMIDNVKFKTSHIETNMLASNGYSLVNGPILSDEAYVPENISKCPVSNNVIRIAGSNRYNTAFMIAEKFRQNNNVQRFGSIVIASGKNFADALAGSYLAGKANAPILITNGNNANELKNFVIKNLKTGGTVYLLGGETAVSKTIENCLYGFGNIKRLAGANRYETNLKILKEAGVKNEDILICTGKSFADSLSASAAKRPILLVGKSLTKDQKAFLNTLNGNKLYIIGGTGAVSEQIANELNVYGQPERISGAGRYETSVLFAEKFFSQPKQVVLTYGKNFPDGLCGSSLALSLDAPLILTETGKETHAASYVISNGIRSGVVLGGESLISDNSVQLIFGQ